MVHEPTSCTDAGRPEAQHSIVCVWGGGQHCCIAVNRGGRSLGSIVLVQEILLVIIIVIIKVQVFVLRGGERTHMGIERLRTGYVGGRGEVRDHPSRGGGRGGFLATLTLTISQPHPQTYRLHTNAKPCPALPCPTLAQPSPTQHKHKQGL